MNLFLLLEAATIFTQPKSTDSTPPKCKRNPISLVKAKKKKKRKEGGCKKSWCTTAANSTHLLQDCNFAGASFLSETLLRPQHTKQCTNPFHRPAHTILPPCFPRLEAHHYLITPQRTAHRYRAPKTTEPSIALIGEKTKKVEEGGSRKSKAMTKFTFCFVGVKETRAAAIKDGENELDRSSPPLL